MRRALGVLVLIGVLALTITPAVDARSAASPTAAVDYSGGQVLSILPPGENGLVNPAQLLDFEATGTRPPASNDQLGKYAGLLYAVPGLTDAQLGNYFDQESFGVAPGQLARVEHPDPNVSVTIYRDLHDLPHVYGDSDSAMAFGAGYAGAEDRLFMMDVLRNYGEGTVSAFVGPSCADEQMDHDQLLLAPYTAAQRQAQVDAMPREYGAQGTRFKAMVDAYVAGINRYISDTVDASKLPADYAAALGPPQPWTPGDVVAVASLIGGQLGKGGGSEVQDAALLQYLQRQLGPQTGGDAFAAFKEQNDPGAPTTIADKSFPYEDPGPVDQSKTAMPDNAAAPLTGGPIDTTPNCDLTHPDATALQIITALLTLPKAMSNALVVDRAHSASGHPLAVFGPQTAYFAPEILMEEDLHSPDYAAEGASFPGVNLLVELGRGQDYAWSATSAGTDLIDQRLELICNPRGGPVAAQGTYYLFNGHCVPMDHETFSETAYTKPGGLGFPAVINHEVYRTLHGVVQGWTTAAGGKPVAVVDQRSDYGHEADSGIGFLRFGTPSLTHDAASWMVGASEIQFTFNWLYVDDRDIAYYVSGLDPIRSAGVNPNLPTWGTGVAEWQGFLSTAAHPHEIDPPQGFFTSWNNKPAPDFGAADNEFGYGPVYRSEMLTAEIQTQFAAHGGRLSRADLVSAMELAASSDLNGRYVLPELLTDLAGRPEPAGVAAMLDALRTWTTTGAHRRKSQPGDAQYAQAAAIATMDELFPRLVELGFDSVFAAGGVTHEDGSATAYRVVPMEFVNAPHNHGARLGSAYDGGWDGYLVKFLRQLRGAPVAQPFPSDVMARLCGGRGPGACLAALDAVLAQTYSALRVANGGTTDVARWNQDTATRRTGESMPAYDAIAFRAIGIVGQPNMVWQNRPTFQQVVEFPAHRPR